MGSIEIAFKIKRHLDIDMEFFNPSKKLKLDLPNKHDANFENDDEWGGDDITAEEFDMLETQATQKLNNHSTTFREPLPVTNGKNLANAEKEEEMRQQQYELEGKVKILSDSITKITRELSDEKINREKIIAQKVDEFKVKESTLKKEIQKLESVLQFKNQEMKTVYDKMHILELQMRENKENSEKEKKDIALQEEKLKEKKAISDSAKFQENFLDKFQFEAGSSHHTARIQNKRKESFRKFKLQMDLPEGKIKGSGIVSSFLCNRLLIPYAQNSFISPLMETPRSNSVQLSSVTIAKLNSDKETEELLDYFDSVLKKYVSHLNGISNSNTVAGPSTTSPLSLRKKESSQDRPFVISVLKDLSLFLSCHQFLSLIQKIESASLVSNEKKKVFKQNDVTQAVDAQQTICDRISKSSRRVHSIFQSLVFLSNPKTYPTCYAKIEEVEWSLAALVSWSSSVPQNFLWYIKEIPLTSFINSYHSVRSLLLVLKLLTSVCTCKEIIPIITHQNDMCVLCSLASLTLQKLSSSSVEFTSVLILVEDILSTLFTVYSFSELKLELSPCPSLILQGIVNSLSKFYEIHKEYTEEVIIVFQKGFTLLHLLSRTFPNFKERRAGFEDNYISLVAGMLTLSKENPSFKDFYDLIHDLWDFQEDTSELDLDEQEPSEDSVTNMDVSSQTSS